MNKLPNEIIRQIRKFDSHPVADLFKNAAKTVNEELTEYNSNVVCENKYSGLFDICEKTFADFFLNGSGGLPGSYQIYNYAWMDDIYVETLKENIVNERNQIS